ncbi:MAG: RNB domain-containing ribonuclease [Phenylobacterium zucineum]|nr:MAG: RNB domain-containing ribonuclease [Phenylobacterium zucineum]
MKVLVDADGALTPGIRAIRTRFQVPGQFPPAVLAEAAEAASHGLQGYEDRTALPFVTLDPEGATDLDQAFAIEASGADLLLHYAIADVDGFVAAGGALEAEAWRRGVTQYLPDGKAPLYPPVLGEAAASLRPDGPRPAVVFTLRVRTDGAAPLDGVARAIVRSRAQLAYETVRPQDLPDGFPALAARLRAAEAARGAARLDPPEQEVRRRADGAYALGFRERRQAEDDNALLSLATNLAVADVLRGHGVGLFRVMAPPDARAEARLRQTARAVGLEWPRMEPLAQFQRQLDPADPRHATFMLAVRRAGAPAGYQAYDPMQPPWHAAVGAPYAHATAPLRRLADRYVIAAVLALANGRSAPETALEAFTRLPPVMARAERLAGELERAVIDLAEAAMLRDREGEVFAARVTEVDERGARIQLCDLPVAARAVAPGAVAGDHLRLRLERADPAAPPVRFAIAGAND